MTLNELLPELLKLNRQDMIQAFEILKHEIEAENSNLITSNTTYEVWSPTISPETAGILQEVLRDAREAHD